MSPVFGIDFGTSNSALSVARNGQVELIDVDPGNPVSGTLKSILYFHKEDGEIRSYVGYEGVSQYIANEAEGRYMQSIKTFLPDTGFEKTSVYGTSHTLESLIAIILKTIKERGEAAIGEEAGSLVLGRPVVFSHDSQRERVAQDRLVRAAKLAGFKEVTFQLEPIAAALAYEKHLGRGREELVMVGDFGAGTSDFTIHRAKGGRKGSDLSGTGDILSVGGVYIGGDNFDAGIMRDRVAVHYGKNVRVKSMFSDNTTGLSPLVIRKLMKWHLIPQLRRPRTLENIRELKVGAGLRDKQRLENLENLIRLNYGYLLFRAIEAAKCTLSGHDSAQVMFDDYDIRIEETIPRPEFQEMIRDDAVRIGNSVDETLAKAGLTPDDIDVVFLTGGSSYIPLIRSIFETRMGADKIRTADAFTSVAYGLGLYGSMC